MAKTCVVAGVGPGIGLAVAKRFAREGYALALIARRADVLKGFADEIASAGGTAKGYPADLTDAGAIRQAVAAASAELGAPDTLVYNASVWREADPMAFDPDLFTRDLALSATGALIAAQAVFPAMKAAGHGTILVTGGGLALKPEYGTPVISLTAGKSAVRGLVLAMAPALATHGIHLATVTVAGNVAYGTPFDPDKIAERFWQVHQEKAGAWTTETVFTGA